VTEWWGKEITGNDEATPLAGHLAAGSSYCSYIKLEPRFMVGERLMSVTAISGTK